MGITLALDWGEARSTPIQPTNVVVVQRVGDEVFLSFGHVAPPIELVSLDDEQASEHVREHPVAVQHVTRRALPPDIAALLVERLQYALGLRPPVDAREAAEEASS